jgi:hypothetical protein
MHFLSIEPFLLDVLLEFWLTKIKLFYSSREKFRWRQLFSPKVDLLLPLERTGIIPSRRIEKQKRKVKQEGNGKKKKKTLTGRPPIRGACGRARAMLALSEKLF